MDPRGGTAAQPGGQYSMGAASPMDLRTDAAVVVGVEQLRRLNAALPSPLAARMRSARLVGERKPVTAVFADIVGSTTLAERMDPEEWTEVINAAFDEMSRCIFRFEGTIAQLQGDAIISFFGAPVAHEDDPERAVRAALEMTAAMAGYGDEFERLYGTEFKVRVGISTGPVLVGNVGSDLRYDYTAIGDTMNVAARLQSAAPPGGIYISSRTERFVKPFFELEPIGPLDLKGKTEAVEACRVLGVKPEPSRARGIVGLESPMVGRATQLQALEDLAATARAGRGRVAVVVADPGIGKSRLIGELRTRIAGRDEAAVRDGAERAETAWVVGRGLSYGTQMPYHVIVDLLRDMLGVTSTTDPATVGIALRRRLADLVPEDHEAYRYLGYLLGVPLDADEADAVTSMAAEQLADRLGGRVLALIRKIAARGPLVLVLEDVHWADAASVEVIKAMLALADEEAILIICATRDERQAAGWQIVTTARDRLGPALTELQLSPLDSDDSRAMVANLLEIESLSERVRELILTKAEGNPFFVEEVIRMLIDGGAIEQQGERWVATGALEEAEIPDTVHGLVLARIDRLPGEARTVLRVASCIDRQFSVPLLEDVSRSGGDGKAVGAALGRLESASLLVLATAEPELEYRFSHALVQDAAYASILKQERRRWHLLVAEALLARYPDREQELAGQLGRHFDKGGDTERAVHYLLLAAEQAQARNAVMEAGLRFRRAAELLEPRAAHGEPEAAAPAAEDDPETLHRRVRAAVGVLSTGINSLPVEDGLHIAGEAQRIAERLGDDHSLADLLFWEAALRRLDGQRPEQDPAFAAVLERLEQLGDRTADEVQRGRLTFLIGQLQWWMGDFAGAVTMFDKAAPLVASKRDFVGASAVESMAGVSLAMLGDFKAGDERMDRAERLAAEGDELAKLDQVLGRSWFEVTRGDYLAAGRYAGSCLGGATEIGALACQVGAQFVLGRSAMGAGDPRAAATAIERALDLSTQGQVEPYKMSARAFLSAAQLASGDLAGADPALRRAVEGLGASGNVFRQAEAQLLRGAVLAANDEADPAEALAELDRALPVFEASGARPYQARGLRGRGIALGRLGRVDDADEALREAALMAFDMDLKDGPWLRDYASWQSARASTAPIQLIG